MPLANVLSFNKLQIHNLHVWPSEPTPTLLLAMKKIK
jgi:hypothetical protein